MVANSDISPRGPYKKRYHHVCESCHRRFMSSRDDAHYCSDACIQHMKRQRRKQRQQVAEEQAAEEQRRVMRAAEVKRQQDEQARRAADKAKQREQLAEEERQGALAERRAAEQRAAEVQSKYKPCECGCPVFEVKGGLEYSLLHGDKEVIRLVCAKCRKPSKQVIRPGRCPRALCKQYHYFFDLRTGALTCKNCKSARQWGEFQIG